MVAIDSSPPFTFASPKEHLQLKILATYVAVFIILFVICWIRALIMRVDRGWNVSRPFYLTTVKTQMMLCCLMAVSTTLVGAVPEKKTKSLATIGEIESVTLEKAKFQLLGRIDTGAQTSSITALKIERYERDGKRWVRFEVPNTTTKKMVKFERPLTRVASIKRYGAAIYKTRFLVFHFLPNPR